MAKTRRHKSLLLVAVGVSVILLAVAGLWAASSRPSMPGTDVLPTAPPPIDSMTVPRVSLDEAKGAFDAGGAVFVDVRSIESYQAGHIPGAVSIPLGEIGDRLQELDPGQWIITYCT